ncbi:MAG: GDYXXLXY domain-containing protein [Proteobacteria bacterium]|nr:GDYXXLXY domain-containing protein [Pseudomonadota bacterium]
MIALARKPSFRFAATALILTGILSGMVIGRIRLLASGREIELAIRPVDPRDLFKGDYARLGYEIATLDRKLVPEPTPEKRPASLVPHTVYVTLEQQPDQAWKAVGVSDKLMQATAPNRVVIKGTTVPNNPLVVRYGIERYFVPEGSGGDIEQLAREKKLKALVAIDKSGNAAIKGLVADGRRVYVEPLL